jgi:hypothetical protein
MPVVVGDENMGTNGSVQCAGGSLGQHRHICAFFNGLDEEHRVLRSFIKEGFDRGDKAFHIVDPELSEDHLRRLAEAGIDVEQVVGMGQLELRGWHPVICSYDLSKFSASAVIDIMRTHPVVIIGEVLQENPFFVPQAI